MISLKHVTKARALISPLRLLSNSIFVSSSINPISSYSTTIGSIQGLKSPNAKHVFLSFKEWFKSRNDNVFHRIFEILSAHQGEDLVSRYAADSALAQLNLPLSESFVLKALAHGIGEDVLSCLKFFDWAGRQPGFHHTRATFHAMFKVLKRSKLRHLKFDFLDNYINFRSFYRVRFYDTLVMGYAIAGKLEIALHLFAKIRFLGSDLDGFAYHVLLNALVEECCFDVVDTIAKQIKLRGFENGVTYSIMLKSLCKQNHLVEAEEYLRDLVSSGVEFSEHSVSYVVEALCKNGKFEQAGKLLEEFRDLDVVPLDHSYGVWVWSLAKAGRLDEALEFLKSKKLLEGYVPEVFRYNMLVSRLLRENRLLEVFDVLMEMQEHKIAPDKVTMNNTLCFLSKAGMVDVALQLYNSRMEFGLSPNGMVYNFLINTLCGDGNTDEAYSVLKNSVDKGFFPGRKTFYILAGSMCREGKLDKMKELLIFALDQKFVPNDSTYDMFISALCRAGRVEDGYLIFGDLNRMNKFTTKSTYCSLITGFKKSNRGDIATRLVIEMQEMGHKPTRGLFRAVIHSLSDMENPETQFLRLLEMQLSRYETNLETYNFFIDGAGHAKRPELARKVYEMIERSGLKPNMISDILMLQSYLKSERISDALDFFNDLRRKRKIGMKLYNSMVVGLCKVRRVDIALEFMREIRSYGLVPSTESYEVLIKLLCLDKKYDMAVHLINDMEKVGRHVTPFIGNTLLMHTLKTRDLYEAWIQLIDLQNETSKITLLGQLIGAFCGRIIVSEDIENIEEFIKQCFPLNICTYNILLKQLCMSEIDRACELFNRMCQKGYEPNQWTYDILVHGLYGSGRTDEAKRVLEEMFRKGLDLTFHIKQLV